MSNDLDKLGQTASRSWQNIPKEEITALRNLGQDSTIVIKEADKGRATVIMDRKDYINELHRQLSDSFTYQRLERDPSKYFQNIIRTTLDEAWFLNYISEDIYKVLINNTPRTPIFYILLKIHKEQRPPVGRPIVSGVNSMFEPLSKYVDFFLQPFVTETHSFVKDTTDFITKVENLPCPESAVLLTVDVVSLYTCIPHSEVCRVVEDKLLSRA